MSANTSEIPIRQIRSSDIESFADALREVAGERRYLAALTPPMPKQISDFVLKNIDMGYPQLVAIDQGRVIGWCDAIARTPRECEHIARMGLGILADFRGQGIGRRLISSCIERATLFGFEKIELDVYHDNLVARALYLAQGFFVEGVRKKSRKVDDRYQDVILMGRFLD